MHTILVYGFSWLYGSLGKRLNFRRYFLLGQSSRDTYHSYKFLKVKNSILCFEEGRGLKPFFGEGGRKSGTGISFEGFEDETMMILWEVKSRW